MCMAHDHRALQQVIKTTQNIIGTHLLSISDIVEVGHLCRPCLLLDYILIESCPFLLKFTLHTNICFCTLEKSVFNVLISPVTVLEEHKIKLCL